MRDKSFVLRFVTRGRVSGAGVGQVGSVPMREGQRGWFVWPEGCIAVCCGRERVSEREPEGVPWGRAELRESPLYVASV